MNIRRIYLKSFLAFKPQQALNLTYPVGHEKAGKALDKICLIGPSGTGKTALLNLIKQLLTGDRRADNGQLYPPQWSGSCSASFLYKQAQIEATLDLEDHHFSLLSSSRTTQAKNDYEDFLNTQRVKMMYFPAEKPCTSTTPNQKVLHFGLDQKVNWWHKALEEIKDYKSKELDKRTQISKLLEDQSISQKELMKAAEEFRTWKATHKDPYLDLADNCLNIFLNRFGLQVDTETDVFFKSTPKELPIKRINGDHVPNAFLSTGTKQILDLVLPLFLLSLSETIIAIDEPERSLYPEAIDPLIELIFELSAENQLFIATHSPQVAAHFEPWEIIKLNFDANGNIYREEYFEGERTVDNCFKDPRFMDWQAIMSHYFDTDPFEKSLRKQAMEKLNVLEKKIEALKYATEKEQEFDELLEEYQRLKKRVE